MDMHGNDFVHERQQDAKKSERTEKGLFNLSISINKAMEVIRAGRVGHNYLPKQETRRRGLQDSLETHIVGNGY